MPLYVAGLIGPGDRKSVQPMATRSSDAGYFDRDYITAQVDNHKFLRALAIAYLKNASSSTSEMAELQGLHLATLALATFKEHVLLTERILGELRA